MGDRAREFIDHWESEHVEAVADSEKRREERQNDWPYSVRRMPPALALASRS
jgi:hypothetical protein